MTRGKPAGDFAADIKKGIRHFVGPRSLYPVPVQRITELEAQLTIAQGRIAVLTLANAALTESLANAELSLKRSRRTARQDGNTLRDEISFLQKRRG